MFETKLRYFASAFWDADSVVANPKDISTLLTTLSPDNFIPFTLVEPTTEGTKNRIAFQTPTNEWQLMITAKRINVLRHPTDPNGTNLGSLQDFSLKASSYLQLVLQHFDIKANRLSLIQEGLLKPMTEEEFKAIYNRLFKYPTFYCQNSPFEWNWRSASDPERTINTQTEIINTIAHIFRFQSELTIPNQPEALKFDRVKVEFDINTTHRNRQARFDFANIISFFQNAILWHQELSEMIFKFIFGAE